MGYFDPLPTDDRNWSEDALRIWLGSQTITFQKIITGSLQAGNELSSSNYVAGTSGWMIDGDGNAEFNDVTVRGDVESGNWDGVSPANLATMDSTATVGYYLDSSVGAAQFMGDIWVGGEIQVGKTTDAFLTLRPSGATVALIEWGGDAAPWAVYGDSGSFTIEHSGNADGINIDANDSPGGVAVITNNVARLRITDSLANLAVPLDYDNADGTHTTAARTFTNTGFLDLDALTGGSGSVAAVSVSVVTGTRALVIWGATSLTNSATTGQTILGFRVSGASTRASADTPACRSTSVTTISSLMIETIALTAGTNVFELQARVTATTGGITGPILMVLPY